MQFMSGRYGMDKLSNFLIIIAAALSFINIFFRIWAIQLVVYTLIVYSFFRILSRNIEARKSENNKFLSFISVIKRKREIYEKRKADTLHVYKKCPRCKAILRLPHRLGVHKTICPKCEKEFTVRVKK